MRGTWKRRATVAGVGLALGLSVITSTASAPSKELGDVAGRQETQAIRPHQSGSRPMTPTGLGEGDDGLRFGSSTDSGDPSIFECLGTVSHASLDNNFTRLMEQARAPALTVW